MVNLKIVLVLYNYKVCTRLYILINFYWQTYSLIKQVSLLRFITISGCRIEDLFIDESINLHERRLG